LPRTKPVSTIAKPHWKKKTIKPVIMTQTKLAENCALFAATATSEIVS
jgi:hypothetical protein